MTSPRSCCSMDHPQGHRQDVPRTLRVRRRGSRIEVDGLDNRGDPDLPGYGRSSSAAVRLETGPLASGRSTMADGSGLERFSVVQVRTEVGESELPWMALTRRPKVERAGRSRRQSSPPRRCGRPDKEFGRDPTGTGPRRIALRPAGRPKAPPTPIKRDLESRQSTRSTPSARNGIHQTRAHASNASSSPLARDRPDDGVTKRRRPTGRRARLIGEDHRLDRRRDARPRGRRRGAGRGRPTRRRPPHRVPTSVPSPVRSDDHEEVGVGSGFRAHRTVVGPALGLGSSAQAPSKAA